MNVPALSPLSDLSQEVQLRREAAKKALSHWSHPRLAPPGPSRVRATEGADGQAVLEAPVNIPSGAQILATPPAEDFSSALLLDSIRQSLIRQEDTIIYSLIERGQFQRNDWVYQADGVAMPASRSASQPSTGSTPDTAPGGTSAKCSLLEWLLRETEQVHGRIRRYTSPIEHPFFPEDLPMPVLPSMTYPQVLAPCAADININSRIMSMYLRHVLPAITRPGTDNNFGSAAMHDVLCLQALSQRIHYGKYVAEAKFQAKEEVYRREVERQDVEALMDLLTDVSVEQQVVERVRRKAEQYGRDAATAGSTEASADDSDADAPCKIAPEAVAELYASWLMPLNKDVQIAYLLRRLDPPS
ncbi:hypothetical protein WJX74_008988 [Apatococcus lobatus]|uniref:chorismate mutase n=1 Tax=Apatococcus lobatus TaxID=904363 RepID=A0AAW1SH24_9CHLO